MSQGGMSQDDFEIWLNHFEHHAKHPRCGPHGLPHSLSPDERRLIAEARLRPLQLGEQFEGRTLLRIAFSRFADERRISRSYGSSSWKPIREEQRHAALLRALMGNIVFALKKIDWI